LALSQLGLRQDRLALSNLERAYAQNPRDTRAGIELAIFAARRGDAAKALKVSEALVALDPANPVLLNFLANVKGRLSDNAGMRAAYERVLAVDPKFRVTVINLSLLDIDERRFDAARSRLQAWFDAHPNDAEAAFLIGTVEERARRPAQALQVWAKVDAMQTRDPRAGLSSIDLLLNQ
jgi:tetratricopeptide (TPR) repeat protein